MNTLREAGAGIRPGSLVDQTWDSVPLVEGWYAVSSPDQSVLSKRPWNTVDPVVMDVVFWETAPNAEVRRNTSSKMLSKAACSAAASVAM